MLLDRYLEGYCKSVFDGTVESYMALGYLVGSRGLNEATIKELGLGYCPRNGEVPGDTDSQRKENSILRGRVVIPIRSEFGSLLAMACRQPSALAKGWWNQRFDKGNHIHLFDMSRRHAYEKDKIYLVEGYFDAIIPWQYGLKNISSLMGTSLGSRRIGLISRYCENVCLMFDTDEEKDGKIGSGQKARKTSIAELAIAGVHGITSIELPVGIDPDMFVIAHGVDALLGLERKVSSWEVAAAKREYLANRNGR